MKKKLIAYLLAVVCVFSCGCGKNSDKDNKETTTMTTTTTVTTTTAPKDETTTTTTAPEVEIKVDPTENKGTAPMIELSGDKNDSFVVEEDCYAVTENAILYFREGITIRGDIGECAEKKLADVSRITGLDFEPKVDSEYDLQSGIDVYFGEGSFKELNADNSYVNILIVNLENDEIEWAEYNQLLLDDEDLYFESENLSVAHHELIHVAFLNNFANLGATLNEGIAEFHAEKLMKEYENNTWSWVQYYFPYEFDDSSILSGKDGFECNFVNEENRSYHYTYGIYFAHFLYETYGENIFKDIGKAATDDKFNPSYDPYDESTVKADDEQLKNIIISVTDDDVFDKFSQWYQDNLSRLQTQWKDYMTSIGEDVSFL